MVEQNLTPIEIDGKFIDIRDLSDFCVYWEDLKPIMSEKSSAIDALSTNQKATLSWLKILADQICMMDQVD